MTPIGDKYGDRTLASIPSLSPTKSGRHVRGDGDAAVERDGRVVRVVAGVVVNLSESLATPVYGVDLCGDALAQRPSLEVARHKWMPAYRRNIPASSAAAKMWSNERDAKPSASCA
jgi:hypothetical protein